MKKISSRRMKVSAAIILLCSLVLAGCAGQIKTNRQQSVGELWQKPSDLLAGVTTAMSYSGFRHGQHPDMGNGAKNPSDAEILEDLNILSRNSNFRLIRLYDSQENAEAVLKIIRTKKINMKVMLGAWLDAEVSNDGNCPWLKKPIPQDVLNANKAKNAKEIERAIRLANKYPDVVVAVNVGNEVRVNWSDHIVRVDSLIAYVRKVKSSIKQPVTIADNYLGWVADGPALAKELDFITVHSYPLWEGKDINEGMSFFIENIRAVRKVIPNSRMVIGETGWASMGSEFGARASEEKQKRYYGELTAWAARMNITTFIFESFDEDWKGNTTDDAKNAQIAEKHWGLFTVDRKAKLVMHEKYPDLMPVKQK
jgi:exo-beta-1,3-glucanase (GH17 family)